MDGFYRKIISADNQQDTLSSLACRMMELAVGGDTIGGWGLGWRAALSGTR